MRAAFCIGCLVVAMAAAWAEETCVLEPAKLRFNDDFGCFRDPENRDGFPGAIKLISLEVEKIGYKIREAQLQKVPYMLVVGDREAAEKTVAVRSRTGGDLGARPLHDFLAAARDEVAQRK
jgi:hypothetical protein